MVSNFVLELRANYKILDLQGHFSGQSWAKTSYCVAKLNELVADNYPNKLTF